MDWTICWLDWLQKNVIQTLNIDNFKTDRVNAV